jgi:hypothetical protein
MKVLGLLVASLLAAPALAADLDLPYERQPPAPVVVIGPALIPPCREAWTADLLRCRPRPLVDPAAPAAKEQLQTVERRRKPYAELFSWSQ